MYVCLEKLSWKYPPNPISEALNRSRYSDDTKQLYLIQYVGLMGGDVMNGYSGVQGQEQVAVQSYNFNVSNTTIFIPPSKQEVMIDVPLCKVVEKQGGIPIYLNVNPLYTGGPFHCYMLD